MANFGVFFYDCATFAFNQQAATRSIQKVEQSMKCTGERMATDRPLEVKSQQMVVTIATRAIANEIRLQALPSVDARIVEIAPTIEPKDTNGFRTFRGARDEFAMGGGELEMIARVVVGVCGVDEQRQPRRISGKLGSLEVGVALGARPQIVFPHIGPAGIFFFRPEVFDVRALTMLAVHAEAISWRHLFEHLVDLIESFGFFVIPEAFGFRFARVHAGGNGGIGGRPGCLSNL